MARRDQKADDFKRRCDWCGKVIPDNAHPRRTFCSEKCKTADYTELGRRARAEARARLTCVVCGGPIPAATRADQIYCSRSCSGLAYRAAVAEKNPPRTCANCGTSFRSFNPDAKFCGQHCYHAANGRTVRDGFACEAAE